MAKRASKKRRQEAGDAPEILPQLALLTELPEFSDLTPSADQQAAFEAARKSDAYCELGCVVRLDRGYPAILTQDGLFRAEFSAALSKSNNSRVAVGDWVLAHRPRGHEMGLIEEILSRKSDIARWRGKNRGEKQTLAANVDVVIVVAALGANELDCARIVRSAVIARDCGADVVIVLTKTDRVETSSLAQTTEALHELLGDTCSIVATSSEQGEGIDELKALIPKGKIAIVLGESGAGKSSLLNALLGTQVLETGSVREKDDAGRHTTVTRRMVKIPNAGIIVDEPGLRSLPVLGHERGLAKVFPDIAEAAHTCRFRDCTHTHEPGCALIEGQKVGKFSAKRIELYLSLAHEMRVNADGLDPDVVV